MPCISSVGRLTSTAVSLNMSLLDTLQARLMQVSKTPPKIVADSDSVGRIEVAFDVGRGATAPVSVTLFKEHNRVRLQMLSHDFGRGEAEKILNTIADALGIKIVDQSNPEAEEKVRDAFQNGPSSARDAERSREAPPRRRPMREPPS
jgi:hypothetical protein